MNKKQGLLLSKVLLNLFVILVNYILSRSWIFRKS